MTVEHTLVSIYHHQGKSENPFVWESLSDCSLCIFSEATITPDTGVEHMTWVKSISHSHSHSDWFGMVKSTRAQKTQLILRFIWKHERNVPGLSVCLSVSLSLSLSLSLEITERAALVNLRTCRFHYKAGLRKYGQNKKNWLNPDDITWAQGQATPYPFLVGVQSHEAETCGLAILSPAMESTQAEIMTTSEQNTRSRWSEQGLGRDISLTSWPTLSSEP